MIYLKKNEETQIVNIPKNGDYKGKLTYEEGFNAGYTDGLNEGRKNPYSTKGFFFENGEKEVIYPVKIDRDTMLQISYLTSYSQSYVEISFYPMGNGCVLANQNDSFIVCAMRGDLLRVFIYNNLQFELPCKQEECHTLRLYTDRVILDGEKTYFNTPYTGGSIVCACVNRGGNGFYRGFIQYMKGVEDKAVMYYISNLDEGGFKRLRSDNGVSDWYENNFVPNWGTFPVLQAKVPLNSVFINVEGSNVCPELTVLDVDSNGRYEGAFSAVNVNVPDVNGSYDEGYNNGYNDGKAEGGSCNIEETRWAEPTPADVDGSGYLVYHPTDGYDGMQRIALQMDNYNAEKYNEGYEAGKAEGGDCDYQDYRDLVLRAKVENAGFVDENTFWNKSKIVKFNEYTTDTADTIMLIDSNSEGWRGDYVTIVAEPHSSKFMLKEGLFSNLEDISELEITCDTIDENAFNGCANLTKLVLPYTPNINENAFKGCTNLKEIEIKYIKNIATSAFDGCPTTGIIKVKDNRFDTSILPSSLSNWKIVYVEDNEVEGIIDVAKNRLKFVYSTFKEIPDFLDFSNVTDMSRMFESCGNLTTISKIDTSNATNMENIFYYCTNLTTIPQLDTSKVTNMSDAFSRCTALTSLPALNMQNLNMYSFTGIFGNTELPKLTNLGGFLNLKLSLTSDKNLKKLPNLTYESCINVLNGLYDFTSNGETPTSAQGELKVHPNFLTTVGDEISIATNKGWRILA